MRILIVAATEFEIEGLRSVAGSQWPVGSGKQLEGINIPPDPPAFDHPTQITHTTTQVPDHAPHTTDHTQQTLDFELLITGVGMVSTAFALGKHLASHQYDLVVNLGIAGSFSKEIALGDVLEITTDTFAELGAEDDNEFLSIEKMGFGTGTYQPSTQLSNLYNLFNTFNLKQANAITVNTVHGNDASIEKVVKRLNPQLESMEGAAFFYACRQMNVPCLQIRAVSNYVEKRNRDNWQIGLAIKNLNIFAVEFIKLYA